MSGALKSVFGGNGGIFGAVLGMASMFFPPLAIAGSMSNLLTSAIGEAVKMAASTLVKEFAMPKFLEGLIGQVVDQVVSKLTSQNPTNPEVDQHVQNEAGSSMNQLTADLTRNIVDEVTKKMQEKSGGAAGKSGKAAVPSAGSWLEAIAIALGQAQGEKAAKMVQLSGDLQKLTETQSSLSGKKGAENDQQANAQAFSIKSQQLQATGQEMSILQNAASNAIKSIGEALSQAARKG